MKLKNVEDIYPLAPAQQGMLFHTLYAPQSGVYFDQFLLSLQGELDQTLFKQAWQQVVDRHPALRTAFVWKNLDAPLQFVRRHVTLPWAAYDWRGLSAAHQEEQLETFLREDRLQGFDLATAPLLRLTLIQRGDDSYDCLLSSHHILFDGWSLPIILSDLFRIYAALTQNEPLRLEAPRPYRDYIGWLQQQDRSRTAEFWRETLRGFTTPTSLWIDHQRTRRAESAPAETSQQSLSSATLRVSAEITANLQTQARYHGVTLNTLTLAAWALLLSRYSGEADILFGMVTSGRPADLRGVETMVGMFINTLPLRVPIPDTMPLDRWLHRLQDQIAEMRQYEHTPLVEIQGWSDLARGTRLFDTIFVFENYPMEGFALPGPSNLTIQDLRGMEQNGYPLTLYVTMLENTLGLKIAYDAERYQADQIAQMLQHLESILSWMAATAQQPLAALSLLTPSEEERILRAWNATAVFYPEYHTLPALIEAQVARTPDAVAVIFEGATLTYDVLNRQANQLAHHLIGCGVRPGALIGIAMERSLELVISLLGILKAGAAYVPFDPGYPRERLQFMIEDAQTDILLTQSYLRPALPVHGLTTICLDAVPSPLAGAPETNPQVAIDPDDLAYVIYTSGSTGRPKGAMLSHRAICNRLLWGQAAYPLHADDRVLQKSPFSFDVSVWEFFWPLMAGAQLILARPGHHHDPGYLVRLIAEQQITTLHFVPSMLEIFLNETGLEQITSLRRVFCSGEALPYKAQERFFARLRAKLHNLYGPTETAVELTFWDCADEPGHGIVPIGWPIANTTCYVLDRWLQPVPIGVAGELYLGGAQVARGYHRRPDLTAEKFVPDPFSAVPGARLYRSGDLVRYRANGSMEFLSRIDYQVKLRGLRIELEEIDAVLRHHPAIAESVVVVHTDEAGDQRLIAYVVAAGDEAPTERVLQDMLRHHLPEYMIPSRIIDLDRLPITPNGKVDRKALPHPEIVRANAQAKVPPRDPTELQLLRLWESIFPGQSIGVTDNFFDLGGHSLLAVRLITEIRKHFQREFPLSVLFEGGTIAHLASLIHAQDGFLQRSVVVGIQTEGTRPPFFCVHPAGGNAVCYTDLARHLGRDYPFYSLQDPGLLGQEAPYTSLEEMAAYYIAELKAVQPEGPYLLGGWSFGGVVAFEMARQLQAQGQPVALLALLDTGTPRQEEQLPQASDETLIAAVLNEIGRSLGAEVQMTAEDLAQADPDQQMERVAAHLRRIDPQMSVEYITQIVEYAQNYAIVNRKNLEILSSYKPRRYAGRITLFRVHDLGDEILRLNPSYTNADFGWAAFSDEPITIQYVPGTHAALVYDPYAPELAAQLREAIDQACQQESAVSI